jgi:hypothetical protein
VYTQEDLRVSRFAQKNRRFAMVGDSVAGLKQRFHLD